ncbi:MAG: hypothetical protein ABIO60_12180 [Aquaticitalea sp.]
MKTFSKNNPNYIAANFLGLMDNYIYLVVLKSEYKKTIDKSVSKPSPENLDFAHS